MSIYVTTFILNYIMTFILFLKNHLFYVTLIKMYVLNYPHCSPEQHLTGQQNLKYSRSVPINQYRIF
ncbi:hypothetical protein J2S21_000906 [Peribacillus cavernae]|nr:hypothetical protein [Peribacillus cavernae]